LDDALKISKKHQKSGRFMDNTKSSIKRLLLGLLVFFCLGTQECAAWPFSWLFNPTPKPVDAGVSLRNQLTCVIDEIRVERRSDHDEDIKMEECFEEIEKIAYKEISRVLRLIRDKKPYTYSPYGESAVLAYEDCASLIAQIKKDIVAGNDYVAKKCLMEFIIALEREEFDYGTKILKFYELFLEIRSFYLGIFRDFGCCVCTPESYFSAEAILNYRRQEDNLDQAFLLTLRFVSAFQYILFRMLKGQDPSDHDYFYRNVYHSLSYCYTLLGPLACPKFSLLSDRVSLIPDTGCSGGAGLYRTRLDTPSSGSSVSFSDASDEILEFVAARYEPKSFSKFVPGYSLR